MSDSLIPQVMTDISCTWYIRSSVDVPDIFCLVCLTVFKVVGPWHLFGCNFERESVPKENQLGDHGTISFFNILDRTQVAVVMDGCINHCAN